MAIHTDPDIARALIEMGRRYLTEEDLDLIEARERLDNELYHQMWEYWTCRTHGSPQIWAEA